MSTSIPNSSPTPASVHPASEAQPGKPRWWRWWWVALLVIIALPTVVILVLWILLRSTPTYWQANQQWLAGKTQQELQTTAQELEQRVTSELSRVAVGNPGSISAQAAADERTIHVSVEEANSWMATRLEPWLANRKVQLPAGMKHTMIAIEQGQLVLAFEVESQGVSQIFSTGFDATMMPDGKIQVTLGSVTTGKLPIPTSVLSQVGGQVAQSQMMDQVRQMFEGKTFDPVMHVDETRNVRLIKFAFTTEALDFTIRTEPRVPKKK